MNTKICPQCQSPIPANAPGGLCPVCVLRDAEEPPTIGRGAPSLAEIAAAFPQLEVLRLIGQGGMGFVYQARQPSLDRTVALKILAPELGRDPAFAERFAREARVLGKLSHPNIVTVFEHGQSGGFFYLLMEYVDGVNLRQAMRAGRFTPQQALAVVPGICDALQAAHAQGIWHRDIKPENILLDARGGVKIADFGIARIVGDPARDFTLTVTGGALGSAVYMAPEQHEKPHDVDHRADIFSLGVVIYEMLTGELPLGRFPAPSERATVSARIDEIVLQTLEKERELRQQSAAEVKTDVSRAARSGDASEPRRATPEHWSSAISRIALVSGVVLFGAAVIFTHGSTQGVMLTLGTTLFALGALGLALGKGASRNLPRVASGQPATITLRSLALILGGVIALAVCAAWYTARFSKTAVQREARHAREFMIVTQQKAKLEAEAKARQPGRNSATRVIKPIPEPAAEPAVPATDVFREMNAFANASNGDEFRKRMSRASFGQDLNGPIANFMYVFRGRVKMLKDITDAENPPMPGAKAPTRQTLFAAIEHSDGRTSYWQPRFVNEQGAWLWEKGVSSALYRAKCRVEFRPETGDAFNILRTHLGENIAQPVAAEGQFDLSATDIFPDKALRSVELIAENLQHSLRSVGLDSALKMIAPPTRPTVPMHAEEAPVEKPAQGAAAPAVPVEDVFRELNSLANASSGDAFKKRISTASFHHSSSETKAVVMEPFLGKITILKPVPRPDKKNSPLGEGSRTTLVAGLEQSDGSIRYRQFLFRYEKGEWHYEENEAPLYRAGCRVEFRPEKGDAQALLRTHLGENVATPVPGTDGQFDLVDESRDPGLAAAGANHLAERAASSLAKVGLDATFKVVTKAAVPARPIYAEDAPIEKPQP